MKTIFVTIFALLVFLFLYLVYTIGFLLAFVFRPKWALKIIKEEKLVLAEIKEDEYTDYLKKNKIIPTLTANKQLI